MRFIIDLTSQLALALTLFFILTYTFSFPAQGNHTSSQITGSRNDAFISKMYQLVNGVEPGASGWKTAQINICDRSGNTGEWMLIAPEQNLRVKRQNNTLVFSGYQRGVMIIKSVQIDSTPWFQPLSDALGQFIDSPQKRTFFWHIRADNLAPVKLAAVKIGLRFGNVWIGQMGYLTEILPSGRVGQLWQASFWFRSGDTIFCRYGSSHNNGQSSQTVLSMDAGQEG